MVSNKEQFLLEVLRTQGWPPEYVLEMLMDGIRVVNRMHPDKEKEDFAAFREALNEMRRGNV